jgi:hypothetical protein
MLKYKYVQTANGRDMYFMNGKMVAKDKLPVSIVNMLEPGVELTMPTPGDDDQTNVDPTTKEIVDASQEDTAQSSHTEPGKCVFCGNEATRQRYVNLTIAPLCENDYQSHTTGEIVARLREVESDDNND